MGISKHLQQIKHEESTSHRGRNEKNVWSARRYFTNSSRWQQCWNCWNLSIWIQAIEWFKQSCAHEIKFEKIRIDAVPNWNISERSIHEIEDCERRKASTRWNCWNDYKIARDGVCSIVSQKKDLIFLYLLHLFISIKNENKVIDGEFEYLTTLN